MRLIIAGSRTIPPERALKVIEWAVELFDLNPTQVISGMARGVDYAGEKWARKNRVPLRTFPADWDRYGKVAGVLRNRQMAEHADALLLVWDGESKGSANMKREATTKGLGVYDVIVDLTTSDLPVTYSYAGPEGLKPTTRRMVLSS